MTRKDYVRFAAMLKCVRFEGGTNTKDIYTLNLVCNRITDIFASDNSRFDRAKFLKACGVES